MRPEQARLLAKARQSLEAAKLMEQEGFHDFAVSRAYYTMFYLAEAFLLGLDLAYSKHSAAIAAFGEKFAKTGVVPAELHRYLTEGQDSRNAADYTFGSALSESDAREQILRAERFLEVAVKHMGPIPPEPLKS